MLKKIFTTLMITLLFVQPAFAVEEMRDFQIKEGDKLYLMDCVSIAILNSPIIKKSQKRLAIAATDVNLAKSDYFPTIGVSAEYRQNFDSDKNYDNGHIRRHLPTVEAYLSQLIYNFGKTTSKIQMQKFYRIAAEYDYLNQICATINDVKLKYCMVLLTQGVVEAERQNVEINEKVLETTKKFYEQKKKTNIDFINAEVYLSDAKMKLQAAENDYILAFADLCNSMYVAGSPDFSIVKIDAYDYYDAFFSPAFLEAPKGQWHEITRRPREKGIGRVQELPFSLDEAYDAALKNSPELNALNSVVEAMKKSVLHTKRQFYPTLQTRVGYAYDHKYRSDKEVTFSNNQLNLSVKLDASVNPMQYKNDIKRANLLLESTLNDVELLRQNIYFNVKRCYYDVKTAEKQIENSKDKVDRALENLKITGDSYNSGQSDYIELQTARQNYNEARIDHIRKLYDYNSSLANLKRATHLHIEEVSKLAQRLNIYDPLSKTKKQK